MRMGLQGVPAAPFKLIFPEADWLVSPDGFTETGLVRSMAKLNSMLEMDELLDHGLGCGKLVMPAGARVGRTLLSFAPPMQIRCQEKRGSKVLQVVITAWLVLLDESGELRSPPNHTYTDAEETSIQAVLRANLLRMAQEEWAITPNFLRLLGWKTRGEEVEKELAK